MNKAQPSDGVRNEHNLIVQLTMELFPAENSIRENLLQGEFATDKRKWLSPMGKFMGRSGEEESGKSEFRRRSSWHKATQLRRIVSSNFRFRKKSSGANEDLKLVNIMVATKIRSKKRGMLCDDKQRLERHSSIDQR